MTHGDTQLYRGPFQWGHLPLPALQHQPLLDNALQQLGRADTQRCQGPSGTAQVLVRGGFGMQFMGLTMEDTMEDTGSFTAPP